jgi:hypothetical protein
MFSALIAIATWAVGHEDLIVTAYKDVAALLGKHFSAPPSHDAQVALQAGIAAAAAQLHQAVMSRGGPKAAAVVDAVAAKVVAAVPVGPVHIDLTGNGA